MTSNPATPLAKMPEDDSEMRFCKIDCPSEWAESYRPGGFHPVDMGDTFKNERYRVIRKLGYGSVSTVWLARDTLSVKVNDTSCLPRSCANLRLGIAAMWH